MISYISPKGDAFVKNNICHFIPYHKDYHSIHTINFVYETKTQPYSSLKSQSTYKIYFVCSGKGNLHVPGKILTLSKGDVFFTFPGTPFCIESLENFTYMYISFLGSRASMIMDNLKISAQNFLFTGCDELYEFWTKGLDTNAEVADLIAESILLYSFYLLGNKTLHIDSSKTSLTGNAALIIKKYIDDNFSQPKLSLETISNELSYSPKYISSTFKKNFNVGIADYLNTIRIQNACTLMNQGFTSISDVSLKCGYTDPLYFSKVFKQKIGVPPKTYIKNIMNDEI